MRIDELRRVVVVGAGRMGAEIALQCAIGGYDVVMHDVAADSLETAASWHRYYLDEFVRHGRLAPSEAEAVLARIRSTVDPAQAAADADLVTESVPENLKLKRDLFARLNALCPPRTVFTTNTSYLQPSQIARHTGRPERFAALHFHPPVWMSNVVDVLPHEGTDPAVVELLRQFAPRIGQIPIVCRGDGYLFNTMLRTWLLTGISLAESGMADPLDIDRAWMGVMGSRVGPFGVLDNIGLDTVSEILTFWGMILKDDQAKRAKAFLRPWIDAGRLGTKSLKGFYDYPDAAYLEPDFLTKPLKDAVPADALIRRFMEPRPGSRSSGAKTPSDDDVPQRYLLRTQPSAVHQKLKHTVRFHGPCLVVGGNSTAAALVKRLSSLGGQVDSLPLGGPLDDVLARFDALERRPYSHLFLLTARDPDAATRLEETWWRGRFERGVLLPFFVTQRWYADIMQRSLFETATLIGATALGGDFGVSGRIDAVEGGGLAGLLKAVYLEGAVRSSLGPQVKVIDGPLDQPPETTVDQIVRELALAQASVVTGSRDESRRRYAELEVGYVRGVRHQVFLEPSPAEPGNGLGDDAIPAGSTWVVTGGARGITAFVARELGRRYRLRLHLLGTTPLPPQAAADLSGDELARLEESIRTEAESAGRDPEAAWSRMQKGLAIGRTLREFAADGARATYHVCDVGCRDVLAATLAAIRAQDGPIAGVLHGAGLEIGSKLPDKRADDVRATLAVKAGGMAALMDLTRDDPLQWFLAFSSLAGRFGNFGQADYSMANDLLAKQLAWFRAQRPECRAVAFHWPGWTDVGMAARPEGKEGLRRGHHTFLAPDDGIGHLINELRQETPAAEVVIVHRAEVPLEMWLAPMTGGKKAPTWQKSPDRTTQ